MMKKCIRRLKLVRGLPIKTSTAHEIADAIRATYRGERVLEPEVTHKMMERLTKQEPVRTKI